MTSRPVPHPTPETQPFWDKAREGELWLQRNARTGEAYFPPRPFFPGDPKQPVEWFRASGRARLLSYVINHRPAAGFEELVPYAIAVVETEEGVRMMANVVEVPQTPDALQLDMALEVTFIPLSEAIHLPVWRPVGGER